MAGAEVKFDEKEGTCRVDGVVAEKVGSGAWRAEWRDRAGNHQGRGGVGGYSGGSGGQGNGMGSGGVGEQYGD